MQMKSVSMNTAKVHQIDTRGSAHHSRAKRTAKAAKHAAERQSWRQTARRLILAIADGEEFSRAQAQYEGYLS